jgi:hypothetical protein
VVSGATAAGAGDGAAAVEPALPPAPLAVEAVLELEVGLEPPLAAVLLGVVVVVLAGAGVDVDVAGGLACAPATESAGS